ncbi:MAG TPA: hypothetical protein VI078_10030 [bacterium]
MKRLVLVAMMMWAWAAGAAVAAETGASGATGGAPAGGEHAGCGCADTAVNPGSIEPIYHTHAAGRWMVSYQFMRTGMDGLRDGTSDVPVDAVSPMGSEPYGYMMTPTKMTMDMQMLMLMYGATDRLTLMAMANYQKNNMDMLMNMGMGNKPQDPMRTEGVGDVELRALWLAAHGLVAGVGVSLPSGSIDETTTMMRMDFRAPYDMQLGSGSVDLRPSLTWAGASGDGLWGWGGQAVYTWRTADNKHDYRLGDAFRAAGWLDRALGPVRVSARLAYLTAGRIRGEDAGIAKILDPEMGAPTPDADPGNYGGQRLDGTLGASVGFGAWRFGVEGGVPLYQNLNGLQLKTEWTLAAGVQVTL